MATTKLMNAKTLPALSLVFLSGLTLAAEQGRIVLFNGTSSAGKSSLAEVLVAESPRKFEVVSFDDVYHSYRKEHGITRFNPQQYRQFLTALYRRARSRADAGRNVIIDTVEFDLDYDRYCEILNCSNVVKAIVYCPLDQILPRIDRRNSADDPSGRRPVLLAFQQFVQMYQPQSSPDELVVERTTTTRIRNALVEAGQKAASRQQFQTLSNQYVKAFGIDRDRELVLVPKGKYDLVLDTRANTKKENARQLEHSLNRR
jgi:chloramphenicol 3-O-phosphotransferase